MQYLNLFVLPPSCRNCCNVLSSSDLPTFQRTCCNIFIVFVNWPPWTNIYCWCQRYSRTLLLITILWLEFVAIANFLPMLRSTTFIWQLLIPALCRTSIILRLVLTTLRTDCFWSISLQSIFPLSRHQIYCWCQRYSRTLLLITILWLEFVAIANFLPMLRSTTFIWQLLIPALCRTSIILRLVLTTLRTDCFWSISLQSIFPLSRHQNSPLLRDCNMNYIE